MDVVEVDLDAPFVVRPPVMDDVGAVAALFVAQELALHGEQDTTVGDLTSDWARPSFDLDLDARCVFAGGSLVGYVEQHGGRAWVAVHPDRQGEGIGSALAAWSERHAQACGHEQVGQTLSEAATAARNLVRGRGYTVRWDTWLFGIDLAGGAPSAATPDGVEIRVLRHDDAELRRGHAVVEAAFNDWEDRDGEVSFEDWKATQVDHPDVVDELHHVALVDGVIVGVAMCIPYDDEGWISQLAVAHEHRGRGIANALMHACFAAFVAAGMGSAGLSTESRTGAKDLYLRVGMRITRSFARFTRPLPVQR